MATIVLSPGAWISTSFYQDFANIFMASGHPVHFAPYPSLNPADPKTADCKHDADAISKILRPLVEDQGRDVVLVMHSYAGMPAAAAASGLSKTKRMKEAKKGGIIGLVFIAAFLVPEGLTCAGLQGGKLPHWIIQDKPSVGLNVVDEPVAVFAADVETCKAKKLRDYLSPHSNLAFYSPQPLPAWEEESYADRLGFIVTEKDVAVPKEAQMGMIGATKKDWIVKTMDCGHCSPFMDRVLESTTLVREFIKKFEKINII